MFLRRFERRKNGKPHTYWALVEAYRTAKGSRQRVVAYLGDGPRTVLDELSQLKSGDVTLHARSPRDGSTGVDRHITLRSVTEPDVGQTALLSRLGLTLPRRLRRLDDVTRM